MKDYDAIIAALIACSGDAVHCFSCPYNRADPFGDGMCISGLMIGAAKALTDLSAPGWISVQERLPEIGVRVLVIDASDGEYDVVHREQTETGIDLWVNENREAEPCLGMYRFWMPLPDPPEVEK